MNKTKIAICYDFDNTLSPKIMQTYGFLDKIGMAENDFWQLCNDYGAKNGAEMMLTCMYAMIFASKTKGVELSRDMLVECGKNIELYGGVETWFDRINAYAQSKDVEIEHYIVSAGLKEMLEGTKIAKFFKKIYASYYIYDKEHRPIWPAQAINFTSKTQFLYRINKGILEMNDNSINDLMDNDERPVPFTNMIYIGDSFTDVPCMRLVVKQGGVAIGVYDKESTNKPQLKNLLRKDKINYIVEADYSENSILEKIVKEFIKSRKTAFTLSELTKLQKKKIDNI